MKLSEDLRRAMRKWATGVTVVAAAVDGQRHGMTVSSFTSVSLEPPLVLVALRQESRTHALVERAGYFGVSVLARGQEEISNRFAGREAEDADRFAGLSAATLVTGAPLLEGSLAWFDCRVVRAVPAGTHTIFLAEVVAARAFDRGAPLLYFDRQYRSLV